MRSKKLHLLLIVFLSTLFANAQVYEGIHDLSDTIPESIFPPITSFENNDSNRIVVVYIGGEYIENSDISSDLSYYNDMKYFYHVVRNGYHIPKHNINMLFGSGIDNLAEIKVGCDYLIALNRDLDDDGVNDVIGGATISQVDNLLDSLALVIHPDQHLLLVFDIHGNPKNGVLPERMMLWDGILTIDSLASKLDSIHCASQCIILNSCYSGFFIQKLKKNGRIILTSANDTQSYGTPQLYNFFIHRWTNAINGLYSLTYGTPDKNEDGFISLFESYNYSSTNNIGYHEPYVGDEAKPQYNSMPAGLGESVAINQLPRLSGDLHIRDTENDWGECGKCNLEYPWNSPDIWIRNDNDSIDKQESEPLFVSANDSIVYIYTRVNNNGYNTFCNDNHNMRFLHLHWNLPSLTHTDSSWTKHDIPISLPAIVDTMSSQIVVYEWHLPQELREYASAHNGRLDVDLLARISDVAELAIHDPITLFPFEYSSMSDVSINPKMALNSVYHNSESTNSITIHTQAYIQTGNSSLTLRMPTSIPRDVQLLFNINGSNPVRYNANNSDIIITGLQQDSIYPITASCIVNTRDVNARTYSLPITLLNEEGDIVGGFTFKMKVDGLGQPLEPEIDDSGDRGPSLGGGGIGGPALGGRTLTMTNVQEPVTCEWTDDKGIIVGNGESINIPNGAMGEYTLTVTSLCDGATASVSKQIRPIIYLDNVICRNGIVAVSLFSPSISGMSIVVRSVVNESLYRNFELPDGISEITLDTSTLDAGMYLVSLYYNNQLLETKQVIK